MSTDELAAEIVGRCRERLDRGEEVDPEDVIRAHPEMAATLRDRFAALRLLDQTFALRRPAGDAVTRSLAGRTLGPYRLESVLGSGGMGTVHLAVVEGAAPGIEQGSRVAVKVIHPHLVAREGFVGRFLREAELGRRVRHENVVRTLDAGEVELDGVPLHFLVMERVEGQTLRSLVEEMGRLPEELCRHVGREIARGLAAIHAAGAVHRDLKPDNVLITRAQVVKVMDLGVARLRDEAVRLSQTGAFVGSLLYGAPEQFMSSPSVPSGTTRPLGAASGAMGGRDAASLDGRADLHALGLVLHEIATGVHPFGGDDCRIVVRRLLEETPRRCGEIEPQLSPFFEELVAHLLEKDRDDRPASADAVVAILKDGERSEWWRERSKALRAASKRPLRRMRIPRETALHGRDAELAKLRAAYDTAKAGEGQVVLVEGEAGIGKSRLLDEFVGQLESQGEDVNFLHGSYPPGGAATASGAFATAYREHLGGDEAALSETLPQTPLLVPAFAALLRGDAAPAAAEPLTKDSLHTAFVHATRSLAAQRPTIVLIDDLHFAPDEGRALFVALALAVPGHRVLLVGTTRPGIEQKWLAQLDRAGATRLPLARLGIKDLVRLLKDALGSEHLAEDLAGRIGTKSDGNPFFVFEILRGLREGLFITRKADGTWISTRLIREIQVPSSISDLVQARICDLGPEDRDVLEVAACIGFAFDPSTVCTVLEMALIPLLQRLGRIEKTHRIVRSAGRRFVFDHHQIQESLYGGLSELLREEYHASIACTLEADGGALARDPKDLEGDRCTDLATHFLRGGRGERALRYLDAAMTHLERNHLDAAASALAERVLELPHLGDRSARFELQLRLAGLLDTLGRAEDERRALDAATSIAADAGDAALRGRAARALGWHLERVGRYEDAEKVLVAASELAGAAGDTVTEGLAWGTLGNVLCHLGRLEEALAQHRRHLHLAEQTGDLRREATATGNIGMVLTDLGLFADALAHHERALAIRIEVGDRRGEAIATGNVGVVLDSMGRHADARDWLEKQTALARQIGDRRSETTAIGNLGNVLMALGHLADARAHYERYLALAREMANRRAEAIALVNLGWLLVRLGDGDLGRQMLGSCLEACRSLGLRRVEGYALQRLGEASAGRGDDVEASRLIDESLTLRCECGFLTGVCESLLARGRLVARAGDVNAARRDFEEAAALAREHGFSGPALLAAGHVAAAAPESAASTLGALGEDESRLDAFDRMEARFLLWRATRDAAHLAEAKRLLAHLVSHAPPECRTSMVENVRLHREIAAA